MSNMEEIDLIVPRTIDEARLQMVRQLHHAVFGDTWARPESPAEVWQMLLAKVADLRRQSRGEAGEAGETDSDCPTSDARNGSHSPAQPSAAENYPWKYPSDNTNWHAWNGACTALDAARADLAKLDLELSAYERDSEITHDTLRAVIAALDQYEASDRRGFGGSAAYTCVAAVAKALGR